MLSKIKTALHAVWNAHKQIIKINITSIAIIVLMAFSIVTLVVPQEQKNKELIIKKYVELSTITNEKGEFTDKRKAEYIQNEINSIYTNNENYQLLKRTTMVSTILVTIVGILATWLQFIYTDVKFTRLKFKGSDGKLDDKERANIMIVLAAALIATAIIVGVVYYTVFQSYNAIVL